MMRLTFGLFCSILWLLSNALLAQDSNALKDSLVKYIAKGRSQEAIPFAEQRAEMLKTTKGEKSREYAAGLLTWGDLLVRVGRLKEAEPVLTRSLSIWKEAVSNNHPNLATPYNTLGLFYQYSGRFTEAEKSFREALAWRLKAEPPDSAWIATTYENLGNVHKQKGAYYFAYENLTKAMQIRVRNQGITHPFVASLQNNIGNLYASLGNYPEAEKAYRSSLNTYQLSEQEPTADYALFLNNLGAFKRRQGSLPEALALDLKAYQIKKQVLPANHPDVAVALVSLGSVYFDLGGFHRSEQYFKQAHDVFSMQYSNDHLDLAELNYNLGFLYMRTGKFTKADSLFGIVEKARKDKLGEKHLFANDIHLRRGMLHFQRGDMLLAEKYLKELSYNHTWQVAHVLPFLTTAEKEKFAEKLNLGKDIFQSIFMQRLASKPELAAEIYNHQLATKAVLLNSNKTLINKIRLRKDSTLLENLRLWEEKRALLARAKMGTIELTPTEITTLEREAEVHEKFLAIATYQQNEKSQPKETTWKDIQKKLRKHQAAIEMVRIRKWGVASTITDTTHPKQVSHAIHDLTDTVYYAALIVEPGLPYPKVVILTNGNELEGKWLESYRLRMRLQMEDSLSYDQFWKPLEKVLGNPAKEIYFSPDGVYNSININTLKNPKTGKFLIEEKSIRLVTNTKDVLASTVRGSMYNTASLIGFPNYNSTHEEQVFAQRSKIPQMHHFKLTRGEQFAELPGTKVEVESISSLLKEYHWTVGSFVGNDATEDQVKTLANPKVLHIATHGFFDASTLQSGNPMLMSGLLLSGANRTLNGNKPDAFQEDGILTAYEALNLNLDQTELVVLSACETGLGQIKSGEGVYGLQRAFKVAGAKNVVMSLWKVDDDATQELMQAFYKLLLAQDDLDIQHPDQIRHALRLAQLQLKQQYAHPYHWGAFVLVGE